MIAQFLEYLSKEVDLTVISVAENDESLIRTYKHIPLLKKSFNRYFDWSLVSKLGSIIKREKVDAVIWEHPYYAWLASIIKKRTHIQTILHTHNIEHRRFESTGNWWWWILRKYEKWFFNLADYILFVSVEDRSFATQKWNIKKEKCIELASGVPISQYPADREHSRQTLRQSHRIGKDEKVLLFNGLLSYKPNLDALRVILDEINPRLLTHTDFKYKIIICGKGLPTGLDELKNFSEKNIIYAGFVPDIEPYFKGADLFLNPVQTGGGIKTKMVEAIAFGTTVIATKSGATGIHPEVCGDKLIVVKDDDWAAFAEAIIENAHNRNVTPASYYEFYYWGSIVKRLLESFT